MAKTSRRSLLTISLALCLAVMQAALLAHPSTTNAAVVTSGPAIYLNPGSMIYGSQTYITVTGTGFPPCTGSAALPGQGCSTPSSNPIVIAFNAPYSADGSPLYTAIRPTPPTVPGRPGDNRPCPPGIPATLNSATACGTGSGAGDIPRSTIDYSSSPAATTPYPNVVLVLAASDGNGNLISAGVAGTAVNIPIPSTAVDGTYEVTAVVADSATEAATQFTIARQSTPQMTATPVSGPSVQINGEVQVNVHQGALKPYDYVQFFLEDFEASNSFPSALNSALNGFGQGGDSSANLGLSEDGNGVAPNGALQLLVAQCGSNVAPSGIPTSFSGGNAQPLLANECIADAQGGLNAVVQFEDAKTGTAIVSTRFYDQVYAIVEEDQTNPQFDYAAGVHLDHGFTSLTLSTNQLSIGSAMVVSGAGFGATSTGSPLPGNPVNGALGGGPVLGNSSCIVDPGTVVSNLSNCTALFSGTTVDLYFVPLNNSNPLDGSTAGGPGTFFQSPYLLASVKTDSNGAFTTTVALSGTSLSGLAGNSGFILAEDFSLGTPQLPVVSGFTTPNVRLNEGATAAVATTVPSVVGTLTIAPASAVAGVVLSTTTGSSTISNGSGVTSISTSGTISPSPATIVISSTVTVTGTGYLPNEAVDVTLSGPNSSGSILPFGEPAPFPSVTTQSCPGVTVAVTHANGAGVAVASFVVPENCDTVTINTGAIGANGTYANAGATVTIRATGEQSGASNGASGDAVVPATAATISPVTPNTNPTNQGGAVILTGTGFAANEPVTFQFGVVDPFTGNVTTPVLSISSQTDVAGTVVVPSYSLTGSLTGALYTLSAHGLASGFTVNVSVSPPFIFVNGLLGCPASSVLPGQPFTITGSAFFGNSSVLVTLVPTVGTPVSVTSGIPAPLIQTLVSVGPGGTLSIPITLPLGTPVGTYTLGISGLIYNPQGSGSLGQSFQEQFRACTITVGSVTPAIGVSPTSGPAGTTVYVSGSGFGPNEPIQVTLQYVDVTGALTGTDVPGTLQVITTTTSTGTFAANYVVNSTVNALIPGTYNITAKGQLTGALARTPFTVTAQPSPSPANTIYFAEGFTGTVAGGSNADFTESLSILNANNYTTTYTVTYLMQSGGISNSNPVTGSTSATKVITGTIAANAVVERSVNTDVGANQEVAAEISSPSPLSAERVIGRSKAGKALDSDSSLGQLIDLTAAAPTGGYNYYFSSGEVMLTNEEYLSLLNPTATAANVTITILPEAVVSATSVPTVAPIAVTVAPNSRWTEHVRADVLKAGVGQIRFGMVVNSNVPLALEREEYYGDGIGSGKYGASAKPAATSLYRQYIFAQDTGTFPSTGGNGAVGTGADVSEVDIINPGPASAGSATVTVSFFDKNGTAINSQQVQVDGGTRETVNVNDVVGTQSDIFSVIVTSDKNVYVEKPTFYGGNPINGGTFAAASPAGSPAGLNVVQFPYLDLTGPTGAAISQTVYLYNPGAVTITVRGTYLSAAGGAPVVKTYTVNPNSITAVSVNTDAAPLKSATATGIGAIFQIVAVGTNANQSASMVALAVGNATDFSNVVADQGTYAIGASTGQ